MMQTFIVRIKKKINVKIIFEFNTHSKVLLSDGKKTAGAFT